MELSPYRSTTRRLIKGDYRFQPIRELLGGFKPTAFVSLFSTELTAPAGINYKFYRDLFSMGVGIGIVSGFYYVGRQEENPIREFGSHGIVSYQSVSPLEMARSYGIYEVRITQPVPSKLFGPDVIEVWKLLGPVEDVEN